jgi:hypothetical protein
MAGKEILTRHTKALGWRLGIWIWVRQDYIVIRGWFNEMRWMDGRNTRGGVRVKVYIDSVNDNGRVQDLKHILFSRDLEKKVLDFRQLLRSSSSCLMLFQDS